MQPVASTYRPKPVPAASSNDQIPPVHLFYYSGPFYPSLSAPAHFDRLDLPPTSFPSNSTREYQPRSTTARARQDPEKPVPYSTIKKPSIAIYIQDAAFEFLRAIIHKEAARMRKFIETGGKSWVRENDLLHDEWVQKKYGNAAAQNTDTGGTLAHGTATNRARPQRRAYKKRVPNSESLDEGITDGDSASLYEGYRKTYSNYNEEKSSEKDIIPIESDEFESGMDDDFNGEGSDVGTGSIMSGISKLSGQAQAGERGETAVDDEEMEDMSECIEEGQTWMSREDWEGMMNEDD
ncbi:hypothetical protein CkaCkLH20_10378 [Colletotrichum karsti]|uniref:Uncharacterized protein n=1 Tax=Colletotrichum karsti TaxID=1095194 RepID=A0A9P6LGC6_9PEZI|nr:uncharacterized protein CkaCkLH20_10378 [Colletotrichum karsti]KAF9872041.1 hypothetical protein CkaCkLH20_10378 [Colletotrichum karsti]